MTYLYVKLNLDSKTRRINYMQVMFVNTSMFRPTALTLNDL